MTHVSLLPILFQFSYTFDTDALAYIWYWCVVLYIWYWCAGHDRDSSSVDLLIWRMFSLCTAYISIVTMMIVCCCPGAYLNSYILKMSHPPRFSKCGARTLCLSILSSLSLAYMCGLGLCHFSGLVCDLLSRWLFQSLPKAIAEEYVSHNLDEHCLEDTRMTWRLSYPSGLHSQAKNFPTRPQVKKTLWLTVKCLRRIPLQIWLARSNSDSQTPTSTMIEISLIRFGVEKDKQHKLVTLQLSFCHPRLFGYLFGWFPFGKLQVFPFFCSDSHLEFLPGRGTPSWLLIRVKILLGDATTRENSPLKFATRVTQVRLGLRDPRKKRKKRINQTMIL